MISNQILQTTIDGLKGITRIDLCICDTEGKVLASTFPEAEEYENSILSFVESPADSQVIQGYQFFKVFDEHQLEYILLAKGSSDDVYMVGKLAAFQIQNLLVAYKERFDKDNFIKNLLLDNLLLVDIYNRAKKLHIETNVRRVVFLIETKQEKDINALETVRSLFATKTKDFITAVDEKNIILVKEVKPNEDYADLEKTASVILDMLSSEAMTKVRVAYGTVVNDIKEVSRSYKEAKMALDVGKIFYSNKSVIAYNNLGMVFAREDGYYIDPDTFRENYYRILDNAGIEKHTFHALRHTFATRALEAGVPIKVVSNILGHATVQITMDTYQHVLPNLQEDAMNQIADYIYAEKVL